jgi:hypothetical protein
VCVCVGGQVVTFTYVLTMYFRFTPPSFFLMENNFYRFHGSIFFLFSFFCGIGVWTLYFMLARQALYYLSHSTNPVTGIFLGMVLNYLPWSWIWNVILLISTSWVARITDRSHQHPAHCSISIHIYKLHWPYLPSFTLFVPLPFPLASSPRQCLFYFCVLHFLKCILIKGFTLVFHTCIYYALIRLIPSIPYFSIQQLSVHFIGYSFQHYSLSHSVFLFLRPSGALVCVCIYIYIYIYQSFLHFHQFCGYTTTREMELGCFHFYFWLQWIKLINIFYKALCGQMF